ncbi:MAG: FAD-binding protein, partial [Cyclobacteriaceae bacterium]
MNRKKFLQTSSAAVVGTGLLGWSCSSPTPSNGTGLKNWAGNVSYHSREVLYPKTLEEVQEAIRKLKLVKALGSQHSFSTIADTEGTHISTAA